MLKRIVLVNPPFRYFPALRKPGYNYCRPPLGICYLASYLRKYCPVEVELSIVDTLAEDRPRDEWIRRIAALKPDVVGFSVVTPTVGESSRMAAELRAILNGSLFVAGGPHATVRPADLLGAFDVVVMGEGERTFLEIVEAAAGGKSFAGIRGVCLPGNENAPGAGPRPLTEPLDMIPPPARDLLNGDAYYHSFPYRMKGGRFTTMFTARGCPNNCYFCGNEILWNRKIRFHSEDYVAAEVEDITGKFGASLVFMEDDDFLAVKSRAIKICGILAKYGRLKWICHACVAHIEGETLKEMKEAGCVEIQIGVESGSEKILKGIPKSESAEITAEKINLIKKYGINAWTTFILGHPEDTPETVMETINFAIKTDPAYASFIALLPFPGTKAFDILDAAGMLKTKNWDDYSWHGTPVFETPLLGSARLMELRRLAQRKYYLRPDKLIRLALRTLAAGSLREMKRNFQAWLSFTKSGGGGYPGKPGRP